MTRASNGRGTLILDKRFSARGRRAIGRIQRASGTNAPKTFQAINAMLDVLYEREEYAPLEAIRDRKLRAIDVYALYRANRLHEIRDAKGDRTLLGAWQAWEVTTEGADAKRSRSLTRRKLAALRDADDQPVVSDRAPISDLPDALRALRIALLAEAHKPSWNRCLAAAQSFVRDTLGFSHPLYEQVTEIGYAKYRVVKRPAPTVAQMIAARNALAPAYAAMWWSMCLTGMGPRELDGLWDVADRQVAIHGTKRESRDRIVPRIVTPVRRDGGWKQFRAALATVGEKIRPKLATVGEKIRPKLGLQVYDARRGYKHLLEQAGISPTRIKLYMGHVLGDVTSGYGMVDLEEFLPADQRTLQAFVAAAEKKARQQLVKLRRA